MNSSCLPEYILKNDYCVLGVPNKRFRSELFTASFYYISPMSRTNILVIFTAETTETNTTPYDGPPMQHRK